MAAVLGAGTAYADVNVASGETKTSTDGSGYVTVDSGGTFQLTGGETLDATAYPSFSISGTGVSNLGAIYSSGTGNNTIGGNLVTTGNAVVHTPVNLTISGTKTGAYDLTKTGSGQ